MVNSMAMKRIILAVGLLLAQFDGLCGGPNLKWIPANAKWVLHVDGAAFRKSKIGGMIVDERLEPEVGKVEKYSGVDLNFNFRDIKSLTAFGSRVGEGGERDAVLLVETSADLRGDAEKLLARKAEKPELGLPFSKRNENSVEFYKLGEDLYVVPAEKNLWFVGKNKAAVMDARDVVIGEAPALKETGFLNYPAMTNNFFIMAAAETSGAGGLPAQARILQKADGVRIAVGEQGDKLCLNLALRAKDAETLAQIRDVAQGLKALVALGAAGNEDLMALMNSAQIGTDAETLTVNLSLPLSRAMQKVREGQ